MMISNEEIKSIRDQFSVQSIDPDTAAILDRLLNCINESEKHRVASVNAERERCSIIIMRLIKMFRSANINQNPITTFDEDGVARENHLSFEQCHALSFLLRGAVDAIEKGPVLYHDLLEAAEDDLINDIIRLRGALADITRMGRVCGEFEVCDHPACQDSCGAWLKAVNTLRPNGPIDDGWGPYPSKEEIEYHHKTNGGAWQFNFEGGYAIRYIDHRRSGSMDLEKYRCRPLGWDGDPCHRFVGNVMGDKRETQ